MAAAYCVTCGESVTATQANNSLICDRCGHIAVSEPEDDTSAGSRQASYPPRLHKTGYRVSYVPDNLPGPSDLSTEDV